MIPESKLCGHAFYHNTYTLDLLTSTMSNPKHLLPNLSKTSFTTWKQKILGHSQQLGLKKSLTSYTPPADSVTQETYEANRSKTAGIHLFYMGTVNYKHFVTK